MLRFFILIVAVAHMQSGFSDPNIEGLKYGRDWDYQPIIINGKEVSGSTRSSGSSHVIYDRYEVIKQVLDQYDRPFTVLDLGANNGFFSLKVAEDYDSICVLVDETQRLKSICRLNTDRTNIIYLQKRFSKKDIQTLASREHFDVILALFVLHHVDDWKSWLDTLFTLGDNVIIETPAIDDPINKLDQTKRLARYLTSLPEGVKIGSFPRGTTSHDHMLLFCQNPNSNEKQTGKMGISPKTFFELNGTIPSKAFVKEMDKKVRRENNNRTKYDQWVLKENAE